MKRFSKKAFTLIELMIVLAVIAILVVVLIPKAGQMKDNSRNAGVSTNVNAVRGVLEAKVVDPTYLGNAAKIVTLLSSNFTGDNALVNPFRATGVNVDADTTKAATVAATGAAADSIVVYKAEGAVPTLANLDIGDINAANKGIVYVYVYADGYAVFGVDSTLTPVNTVIIK